MNPIAEREAVAKEMAIITCESYATIYNALEILSLRASLNRPVIAIAYAISQKLGVSFDIALGTVQAGLNILDERVKA